MNEQNGSPVSGPRPQSPARNLTIQPISVSVTPPEEGVMMVVPDVPESPNNKSRRTSWENKNLPAFDLSTDKTQCPAQNYSKTTVHVRDGGFLAEPMCLIQHKLPESPSHSKPRQLSLPPGCEQAVEGISLSRIDSPAPSSPRRPDTPTISISGDEDDDPDTGRGLRRHTLNSFTLDEQNAKKSTQRRSSSSSVTSGSPAITLHLPGEASSTPSSPKGLTFSLSSPLPDLPSPSSPPRSNRHSWSPPQSPPSSPETRRQSTTSSPKTYLAPPGEKDSSNNIVTEKEKLIRSLLAQQPKVPASLRVRARAATEEGTAASASSSTSTSAPASPSSPTSPRSASPTSPPPATPSSPLLSHLPHNWPQMFDQARVLLILLSLLFVYLCPPVFAFAHLVGVAADLSHVSIKTALDRSRDINPWMMQLAHKFSTPVLIVCLASLMPWAKPLLCLCLVCSVASSWTGSLALVLCAAFKPYPALPSALLHLQPAHLHDLGFKPAIWIGPVVTAGLSKLQDVNVLCVARVGHELFLALAVVVGWSGLDASMATLLLLTLPCFAIITLANAAHLLGAVEALSHVEHGKISKLKSQ